ncbi:MAG: Na+/H+ antiporter [Acidobacteriota bacterium]|nr:Na+/H+ antiporter [Acidobacteriota bacterium]
MFSIEILIALLVAIVVLVRLSRFLELPSAILLLVGGLALSFVPGFNNIELAPEMIFTLFLPPLLFVAAVRTSWRDFRQNVLKINLLAIGLVIMTTLVIGLVAHWAIPGLPLAAAFALGAIVSPTDAIAATSITKRLGVPRRIVTVLEGESLVNDATGIVVYKLAAATVLTGAFSIFDAGWQFVLNAGGGIAIGLALGWLFIFFIKSIEDAPVEITITLIAPFTIYIAADGFLGVSGVLAVVAAGYYFSRRLSRSNSSETRLQAISFWNMLDFLFNGVLFLLVGLQLRRIVGGLNGISFWNAVGDAAIVSAALIVTRILWVFPVTYLPRFFIKELSKDDPLPSWKSVFVVAWTGMRGAISLAAALALPLTLASGGQFPNRNLIIFITFFVILATLVVQGLSLPAIIRHLHLKDDGATAREEAAARLEIYQTALERIEEIENGGNSSPELVKQLKENYRLRADGLSAIVAEDENSCQAYFKDERNLKLDVIKTERDTLANLIKRGALHNDAARSIENDLDLEEQRLQNHN